jgi:hypothetical protein
MSLNVREDIANELHKPARRNFKRRKIVMKGLDNHWQCDLIDMKKYSRFNKGYKYILVVIDVFSKFAWARPLKNKTGKEITLAMGEILKLGRKPKHLQSDLGTEFYNEDFKKLMAKYKINLYSTYSSVKACVAERFIRTIKNWLWKRFTVTGSYGWISILDGLVKFYNSKKHSTIKMKPIDVTKKTEKKLFKTVYASKKPKFKSKPRFELDDFVRISKYKGQFEKGYTPNFSTEIFRIIQVLQTEPVTYKLADEDNQPIAGGFYQDELVKVKHKDIYLVEKVVKKKGDKVLVKWLGFPSSKNSWIDKDNIV